MGTPAQPTVQPSPTPVQDDNAGLFSLPSYDFAKQIPTPASVGVRPGDSIQSVTDAMKGVAYYGDVIGFGSSSSSFTSGMSFQKLGTNFFMKTGMQCSNGADMWTYFEGIPKGDAFGKNLQRALSESMGVNLTGLAPGMIEDSKAALNMDPIVRAIKGDVFYECKQEEKPVGDQFGRIQDPNPEPGKPADKWIIGSDVIWKNNRPFQKKWVASKSISQDAYDKAPKTHNPDGTLKSKEGFMTDPVDRVSVLVAVVLLCTAFAITNKNK